MSVDSSDPTAADGPLRRWSRHKLESAPIDTAIEVSATTSAPLSDTDEAPVLTPGAERVPKPSPSKGELPALESLHRDSDYSGFLSPEVDAGLRRAALRKLFHLPSFAIRDGLDDYDDDFAGFEGLGEVITQEMKRQLIRQAGKSEDGGRTTAAVDTVRTAGDASEAGPQTPTKLPADNDIVAGGTSPIDETPTRANHSPAEAPTSRREVGASAGEDYSKT